MSEVTSPKAVSWATSGPGAEEVILSHKELSLSGVVRWRAEHLEVFSWKCQIVHPWACFARPYFTTWKFVRWKTRWAPHLDLQLSAIYKWYPKSLRLYSPSVLKLVVFEARDQESIELFHKASCGKRSIESIGDGAIWVIWVWINTY